VHPVSVLSRYAIREVLAHLAGVLGVVLAIFLVRRFGSLLDEAADGSLPTSVILHLLGLRTIVALPSLVPAAFYLSVILALGRLYRDEEMTALAGCGVSPGRVRGAVLGLAALAAVAVGFLSFAARPWAAAEFDAVRERAAASLDIGSMSPGRFYETDAGGEQIVFAEGRTRGPQRALEHVFVQQRTGEHLSIFVAERAEEDRSRDGTERTLRLLEGYRYDLDVNEQDYEITQYAAFAIRTVSGATEEREPERSRDSVALLASADPRDRAEFEYRLAMPVSTILLVLLAIPLSPVRPRQGKYEKVFLGLLLYVVYRQLLGAAKSWVADEIFAGVPWFWVIHAACFALACWLFRRERA
jgi:lipopolysaccharide export system permease protein